MAPNYLIWLLIGSCFLFFFFNDTATTEIYTLSLHDALPISAPRGTPGAPARAPLPRRRPALPAPLRRGCRERRHDPLPHDLARDAGAEAGRTGRQAEAGAPNHEGVGGPL